MSSFRINTPPRTHAAKRTRMLLSRGPFAGRSSACTPLIGARALARQSAHASLTGSTSPVQLRFTL
eukprot:2805349-Pleurochrysis_carterae.AAC.1